jgi:hypothetical protein
MQLPGLFFHNRQQSLAQNWTELLPATFDDNCVYGAHDGLDDARFDRKTTNIALLQ